MNITEVNESVSLENPDFYLTSDLTQRLDLISHLLANTSFIPFVQSTEGCGKTRLARHLADTLSDRYTISLISGGPLAGINDLRAALAKSVGISASDEVSDELLEAQFCKLAERKKNFLLLLDDADQLAADSLSWIIEFFSKQKVTCTTKCVIFSAVDVLALPLAPMQLSKLNDNIQILDIPKFTVSQMRGFIDYIRSNDLEALSDAQLAALQKQTQGIPGKVLWQVQFTDLQHNEPELVATKSEPWLRPFLILAILGFLVSVGLIYYFQNEINQFVANEGPAESDETIELQTLVIPQQAEMPMVVTEKREAVGAGIETAPVEELPVTDVADAEAEITEEVSSPAQVVVADVVKPEVEQQKTERSVSQESPNQPAGIEPDLAAAEKLTDDSVDSKQLQEPAQEVKAQSTKQVETRAQPPVSPSVPKAPELPPAKAVATTNNPGFKTIDWLYAQGDSAYTLQLLAVSDRSGIERFVKKHNLNGDIVILQTLRNGKAWYSLLFGAYSSRDEAVKEAKRLPKSYKSSSAWPRSVESVKQSQ